MDFASVIGVIVAFGSVALGYMMDGGDLKALWLLSALVITGGGAVGAVILSFSAKELLRTPAVLLNLFKAPKSTLASTLEYIVSIAESARRDGLLSLESKLDDSQSKEKIDPLLKKGLLMVIDGAELDQIRDFMDTDIGVYEQQIKTEISMFEAMATYAPAYGMIGTIVGLIQVLANMESPEQMASAMAVAFITTLYGSLIANGFCLPAAGKLKARLSSALLEKNMIIEGVCSIRNGQNPKMLREKLSVYLQSDPKAKKRAAKTGRGASADAKKNR